MTYPKKLEPYLKENLFAQSLHPKFYERNPNFAHMAARLKLDFKAHPQFTKADIDGRQALVQRTCELIWRVG